MDVQSARRQTVVSNDVLKAIPTVRSYNALVVVVPGVVTNTNDVATGTATTQFPIHGGRNNEGRMTVDGLNVGNPPGGNQPPGYSVDVGNSQEISFTTSGGLGESETAGLVMNVVPKTGGNALHGSLFYSGSGKNLQADNSGGQGGGADAADQGVRRQRRGRRTDLKDRLWYFATARTQGSTRVERQPVLQPERRRCRRSGSTRPTRASPDSPTGRGRTSAGASPGRRRRATRSAASGTSSGCAGSARATPSASPRRRWSSPEANGPGQTLPLRVPQVTWSSPVTNRLLLDAGFGGTYYGWGNFERDPNPTRDLIKVTEQCATGCAANGNRPGIVYRSQDWGDNRTGSYMWKGTVSYVTGRHSFKVGYQHTLMTDDRTWYTNSTDLWYRFNNGVPNQLTQTISPWVNNARAGWHAVFAQEQWTMGRLTLQGAVRFDVARSWFPEQNIGPDRFLPVAYHFPETKGIDSYKDITPRLGVAYDVFGNGRTAVKMNLGRYLEGVGVQLNYANTNPTTAHPDVTGPFGVPGVTRTWTDANGEPRAQLRSAEPAGQRIAARHGRRADFCGQISNLRFGQPVLTGNYDPELLSGWGVRAVGLEPRRLGPAADAAAHVGRGRLLPAVVRRLHAERQPRWRSRPTTRVQRHRALRSAAARTAAATRSARPLRRRAGQVRAGRQPGDARRQVRRVVSVLQRRRRHGQPAARAASRSRAARAPDRTSRTRATSGRIFPS